MRPESSPPRVGADLGDAGVVFRVWAPARKRVELCLEAGSGAPATIAMRAESNGFFEAIVAPAAAGTRYRYRVDGEGPFPDPASRFQPDGVHGASEVIDPSRYRWSDSNWKGIAAEGLVVYELHVGTFTPAGTFLAAIERLSYLRELGIGAIELMPLADFAGNRNWGYDGVALFAPARCYGSPDELRQLIDAAHGHGIGVFLDAVYNHFGADGAYVSCYSAHYLTDQHQTPWGAALNLDALHSEHVRSFLKQNAHQWLDEYHFDGLRLDATHALIDEGPRHFLAELSEEVHARPGRARPLLIAEDHRNLAKMIQPIGRGGWGLDGVWADDLHHQLRCALTDEHEGYYGDYSGSLSDIAATLKQGWFYDGKFSHHLKEHRGTDGSLLSYHAFVVCLQNHDQIGNRAFGERLNHLIDPAAYRAASVVLLTAPQTPLLFMGQEWAATSPFLYFTDHKPELGRLVTEGRQREFASFAAFRDAEARARIPDPQAETTFTASKLDWSETDGQSNAGTLRLYRELLRLRREHPALANQERDAFDVTADEGTLLLTRRSAAETLVVVVRLRSAGSVSLDGQFERLLTTEDPRFAPDPIEILHHASPNHSELRFTRPGAVILKSG